MTLSPTPAADVDRGFDPIAEDSKLDLSDVFSTAAVAAIRDAQEWERRLAVADWKCGASADVVRRQLLIEELNNAEVG